MTALVAREAKPLAGTAHVPGDKSISHRALMIGALAVGRSVVRGLLESADVAATADALRRLGVAIEHAGDGVWHIDGVGIGGLAAPADILDLGNSGTGARLLCGILASHPIRAQITGDASLRARPMGRVADPLRLLGARIDLRDGRFLPMTIDGAEAPVPLSWSPPVPSAQVKSAILLAGLNTPGKTTVIEPAATRDHTEIMLRHFGVDIAVEADDDNATAITLTGQPELYAREIVIPGDPSSAAFPAVAAAVIPGSRITLEAVGVNPLRAGLYETLAEMGADIALNDHRAQNGEAVADIAVTARPLHGIDVAAERAPRMIDEYPILAIAASCAEGRTVLRGLGELRVKESDRLAAITRGLTACGVAVEQTGDTLAITGAGGPPPGGARIATAGDHRIAMAFLMLGMAARAPVEIDDSQMIGTSFPGFVELMNGLGADIAATRRDAAETKP